jgi:hypothetical protein
MKDELNEDIAEKNATNTDIIEKLMSGFVVAY